MIIPKEGGIKYVIKFDPSQVADAINSTANEETMEQESDDVEAEAEMEEEDFEDEGAMPFSISVEVHREGKNKFVAFDAEASPAFEAETSGGEYDLYITDMYLSGPSVTYEGPSFETLDEELREQFDQLVSKNFRKFLPLVAEYARAKEANQYSQWLADLKEIASGAA